ncbi:MAG TPA: acetyltransferase [Chloroflexota bacterium]|nr:acetyltransferase [Chloroflexota bacterium]HZS89912.1 acetyltransferase [Chloroflexota bacterium]
MNEHTESFDQYALVEIMGHVRLAGRVREETHFGTALLRVDVPRADGQPDITRYYGPQAIYSVTPCTEETARAVALKTMPEPINRFDARNLLAPPAGTICSVCHDDTSAHYHVLRGRALCDHCYDRLDYNPVEGDEDDEDGAEE